MTVMANSGKELEEFVKAIESVFLPAGFKITSRERIYDDQNDQIAELDVFITGTLGTTKINWLIECRDRPSMGPAPRSWIEQLYGRLIGLKLSKVTAVSTTSFSPGAVKFAKDHGIELRTVQEITQDQIKTWFIAATLTVNNVIGQMKQVRAFFIVHRH